MIYRPAVVADKPRIIELHRAAKRDTGDSPLFKGDEDILDVMIDNQSVLVAELDGDIVGLVNVIEADGWNGLSAMSVDGDCRRMGVASGLIAYAQECFNGSFFALARDGGDGLYRSAGFVPVATLWERNAS